MSDKPYDQGQLCWPGWRGRARSICGIKDDRKVEAGSSSKIFEPPRFFEAFLRGRQFR